MGGFECIVRDLQRNGSAGPSSCSRQGPLALQFSYFATSLNLQDLRPCGPAQSNSDQHRLALKQVQLCTDGYDYSSRKSRVRLLSKTWNIPAGPLSSDVPNALTLTHPCRRPRRYHRGDAYCAEDRAIHSVGNSWRKDRQRASSA